MWGVTDGGSVLFKKNVIPLSYQYFLFLSKASLLILCNTKTLHIQIITLYRCLTWHHNAFVVLETWGLAYKDLVCFTLEKKKIRCTKPCVHTSPHTRSYYINCWTPTEAGRSGSMISHHFHNIVLDATCNTPGQGWTAALTRERHAEQRPSRTGAWTALI